MEIENPTTTNSISRDFENTLTTLEIFLQVHRMLNNFSANIKLQSPRLRVNYTEIPVNEALNVFTTAVTSAIYQNLPDNFFWITRETSKRNGNNINELIDLGSTDILNFMKGLPACISSDKLHSSSEFLRKSWQGNPHNLELIEKLNDEHRKIIFDLTNLVIRESIERSNFQKPLPRICRYCNGVVQPLARQWGIFCCKDAELLHSIWQDWILENSIYDIADGSQASVCDATTCPKYSPDVNLRSKTKKSRKNEELKKPEREFSKFENVEDLDTRISTRSGSISAPEICKTTEMPDFQKREVSSMKEIQSVSGNEEIGKRMVKFQREGVEGDGNLMEKSGGASDLVEEITGNEILEKEEDDIVVIGKGKKYSSQDTKDVHQRESSKNATNLIDNVPVLEFPSASADKEKKNPEKVDNTRDVLNIKVHGSKKSAKESSIITTRSVEMSKDERSGASNLQRDDVDKQSVDESFINGSKSENRKEENENEIAKSLIADRQPETKGYVQFHGESKAKGYEKFHTEQLADVRVKVHENSNTKSLVDGERDTQSLPENSGKKWKREENGSQSQEILPNTIEYQLSNGIFIKLGWTSLPAVAIMRKVVQYETDIAKPHLNWFKNNRFEGKRYYDNGRTFINFHADGSGEIYYPNGKVALRVYTPYGQNYDIYIAFTPGGNDLLGGYEEPILLSVFDSLGNGIVFDDDAKTRLSFNQIGGICWDNPGGLPFTWTWNIEERKAPFEVVYMEKPVSQFEEELPNVDKSSKRSERIKSTGKSTRRSTGRSTASGGKDEGSRVEESLDEQLENKCLEIPKDVPAPIKRICLKLNEYFSLRILDRKNVSLRFSTGNKHIRIELGTRLNFNKELESYRVDISNDKWAREVLKCRFEEYLNSSRAVDRKNSLYDVKREYSKLQRIARQRRSNIDKYKPHLQDFKNCQRKSICRRKCGL